ncbi:cilia- and flagella-associated protein 65 isoform X2 [Maylandia zebra]|uniref:cilia- and flagella-associated protein 65 isoform X2 n=1 Tax=Maylandia zebra TaxID=106582 RepID=UPI00403D1D20
MSVPGVPAMLAETRGPDPLVSAAPREASVTGNDIKDPGIPHRQRVGKCQRRAPSQRNCFFGVETRPELAWEDWDLGREFTKTLVLKNVHNKLKKLHIRPPVSKIFSTLAPHIAVISPGTSFSIQVTFKPLQRCEYEDSIEFQGKEGSFHVCLRAVVPSHTLEVPESVMLPLCAVEHSTHTDFPLKNASKLHTYFQWECPAPFQLRPEQGLLKPGQECHTTVVFRPQEALVYQQQALCRFGEEGKLESSCTVLLQGLAKYPHLLVKNPSSKGGEDNGGPLVDFGPVAVGKSLQKHFDIFNPSPVTASFSLSRLPGGVPSFGSEFSCDATRGRVAPGGSRRVSVTYSPAVVDTVSVEYLSLNCKGTLSESLLKLSGHCIGPKVALSSSVVDFECVEAGGSVVRTVELVNASTAEAFYQWDIDCSGNSVFSILPASGAVLPHSHTRVKAAYRPTQPNAHYRRVACLVLDGEPVFLDLIGTCHSGHQKPAILKPEHLVLHTLQQDCRQNSPHAPAALRGGHKIESDQKGLHSPVEGFMSATAVEDFYRACLGHTDPLCLKSSLPLLRVSVAPTELLFNHKHTSSSSPSSAFTQSVSITNHTRRKLSLVWTAAQESPFSIAPSSCDLAPLKSTLFRVTYAPKQLNTLHGAQLECFAYDKHSPDTGVCPPWCVTIRVIGHSFQPGKEHFTPRCSVNPPHVVFPALSVISYRTVLLHNVGDWPLTFCLERSSNPALAESAFVVPSCGLIQPGDHQILSLRAVPAEDSSDQGFKLHLQLNASKLTKELTVVSVVEKLCVSLEGGSTLYFQPTAVGSQAQRTHHIRNRSLLPVRFQWSIPEPDQELISVKPDAGELHPNECCMQTWTFSPLAENAYTLEPTLTYWPVQSHGSIKSHLTLVVEGVGSRGWIEAEKSILDVGETLVGSCRTVEIPVVNKSPCPVSFGLSVQQILLDDEHHSDSAAQPSALQLDLERGTVASHSTMVVRSTIRPNRQAEYLWTITYTTLNASGCVMSSPQALCEVRARGVFPTLQAMDAWSCGCVGRLSKTHIWKLFSLDCLNDQLLSNPSSEELTFQTPTRHRLHTSPSIFTKTMLDFNFGSAPVDSDPSDLMLMLHNPGCIPVHWAFLFPEDQQIELEYWAVMGEFSNTELSQMKVQDNQLFSVSPRAGTLLPGQKRAVHFSYSHVFVGTDHFPVVFKLSYGREILLNFQGATVERDQPHLHFDSHQHFFTSVTIGDCSPPKQVYELHNGGAVPVCYEVDTAVLSQLQADNFDHPVLRCLNPQGEIPPGKTAKLEWIFSPLEAKTYHVDVPIHIGGSDSAVVRFEGRGLSSLTQDSSNHCNSSDCQAFVPSVTRVPFPGQVLFLSEDSIFLGDIPVCSQSSRIFFLTNVSCADTAHYEWDLPQHTNQQEEEGAKVVQIHPDRGRLRPGECALCVLTFTSTDYPTVHQLDVVCQVTLEAERTRYNDALQRWEEERERQKNEFIITDKNITESQRVLIDETLPAVPVRKGPPLRKYKTLPPICASGVYEAASAGTKLRTAELREQRQIAKVWRRPDPPRPALLYLRVTAHSHDLIEYLKNCPDYFNKHYRSLQSVQMHHPEPTVSTGLPAPAHSPDKEILFHILSCLLRDILDDSAFIQRLISSASKPDTYRPAGSSSPDRSSFPSSSCQCLCPSSSPPARPQTRALSRAVGSEESAGCSGNTPHTREHVSAFMSELVLMNTLQNLMMEAVRGELVLTACPRSNILPPVSTRRRTPKPPTGEEKTHL